MLFVIGKKHWQRVRESNLPRNLEASFVASLRRADVPKFSHKQVVASFGKRKLLRRILTRIP